MIMKKTTITAIILFMCIAAQAQFEKGTILAGGNFGFDSKSYKAKQDGSSSSLGKETIISFGPQVGFFVADNIAVGAGISIESASFKAEGSSGKNSEFSLLFSPMARFYLEQGVFFQGRFDVGSSKSKESQGSTSVETTQGLTGWALSAGYAAFLNDYVALEPQLGYGSLAYSDKDSDGKLIESGIFIRLGIQVYLRKK
jgi:hypothetical protein